MSIANDPRKWTWRHTQGQIAITSKNSIRFTFIQFTIGIVAFVFKMMGKLTEWIPKWIIIIIISTWINSNFVWRKVFSQQTNWFYKIKKNHDKIKIERMEKKWFDFKITIINRWPSGVVVLKQWKTESSIDSIYTIILLTKFVDNFHCMI